MGVRLSILRSTKDQRITAGASTARWPASIGWCWYAGRRVGIVARVGDDHAVAISKKLMRHAQSRARHDGES
jgi:hypothetical protein